MTEPAAPEPTRPPEFEAARRRTMRLALAEGMTWSVMFAFGETYLVPFAVFLKASNPVLALLGTMPALIGVAAQQLGAALADRLGRRQGLLVPLALLQALAYLPIFLAPRYVPAAAVPVMLLFAALCIGAGHAMAPPWTSLMSEVVPAGERGDYFGRRGRLVVLGVFLATVAAGGLLARCQQAGRIWLGFGLLFGIASLMRLGSVPLLARHVELPYRPAPHEQFTFWQFLRRLPHSNFARFAAGVALMNGAISVASPFVNVFFLRDLGWSYARFTLNALAFQAVQFLLVRWWGRTGDRYGNRAVIVATSCLLPVVPVLFALTTNYWWLLAFQLVSGTAWSGYTIATQNFMFDAVSVPKRARISAYCTLLNGLATLLAGTLLGAWLASHLPAHWRFGGWSVDFASPLQALFIVSALLRLGAALLLLPAFREGRPVEPIHPGLLLLRLSGGEALAGLLQQAVARLPLPRRRT